MQLRRMTDGLWPQRRPRNRYPRGCGDWSPSPRRRRQFSTGSPQPGSPRNRQISWGAVSGDHHAFAALVLDHLADNLGAAGNFVGVDYEDHAEAHVERPKHLVVGDVAAGADELEDRTDLP